MYFVIEVKLATDNTDYPKWVSFHTARLGSVTVYNGRFRTHSQMAHLLDIRLKAMASVLRAVIIQNSLMLRLKNAHFIFGLSLCNAAPNSKALARIAYFKHLVQSYCKDLWCLIPVFSVYIQMQGASRWVSVQIWAGLSLELAGYYFLQAKMPGPVPLSDLWLWDHTLTGPVRAHWHWFQNYTV